MKFQSIIASALLLLSSVQGCRKWSVEVTEDPYFADYFNRGYEYVGTSIRQSITRDYGHEKHSEYQNQYILKKCEQH